MKFTSSGAISSEDQPYFFEQSKPIILYAAVATPVESFSDLNGTYVLRDGIIILKSMFSNNVGGPTTFASLKYTISVESPDRIFLNNSDRTVTCDKQS